MSGQFARPFVHPLRLSLRESHQRPAGSSHPIVAVLWGHHFARPCSSARARADNGLRRANLRRLVTNRAQPPKAQSRRPPFRPTIPVCCGFNSKIPLRPAAHNTAGRARRYSGFGATSCTFCGAGRCAFTQLAHARRSRAASLAHGALVSQLLPPPPLCRPQSCLLHCSNATPKRSRRRACAFGKERASGLASATVRRPVRLAARLARAN